MHHGASKFEPRSRRPLGARNRQDRTKVRRRFAGQGITSAHEHQARQFNGLQTRHATPVEPSDLGLQKPTESQNRPRKTSAREEEEGSPFGRRDVVSLGAKASTSSYARGRASRPFPSGLRVSNAHTMHGTARAAARKTAASIGRKPPPSRAQPPAPRTGR
ncbi:hypothetical protein BDY21DRAFT_343820 [Lineolata rhizophorae]|uniref:Uncharacterized protein n=1 Tax=Lineolata rhizophorae TaxID=578093 RepID=A0A6A6P0T1_9PEZI|nr:hypothetical protein BDY21DRAFT_343820 [Lineolata rhizophorae]